jgi:hypothetical protein
VAVRDSAGVERTAPVVYSSTAQLNVHLPSGLALGAATLIVSREPHQESRVPVEVAAVAPGLFTATVATGAVTLFGTGIRGASGPVVVWFGDRSVVAECVPLAAGLDQVNVKPPEAIAEARVAVEVDGKRSNALTLRLDYTIATGRIGEPVAPRIFNGRATKRNSATPAAASSSRFRHSMM